MNIIVQGQPLEFLPVPIVFSRYGVVNVFAKKNNKTLGETLHSKRYASLSSEARRRYPNLLQKPLGDFLYSLKTAGDSFYLQFLNEYGDGVFCDFGIASTPLARKKGLYCFTIQGAIKYVGRSHDPFEKRLNQGYGHISPKNCYKDGQSTNCHVNSLIAANRAGLEFHACPLDDDLQIDCLERLTISLYKPE